VKSAAVTVNSVTTDTTLYSAKSFSANPSLPSGSNSAAVSAVDGGNNTQTNNYSVSLASSTSQSFTYDANGNMLSDGTNTFAWDAENRLVRISYTGTGNSTTFAYDAIGHRVKTTETTGGTVSSVKQFVCLGSGIS